MTESRVINDKTNAFQTRIALKASFGTEQQNIVGCSRNIAATNSASLLLLLYHYYCCATNIFRFLNQLPKQKKNSFPNTYRCKITLFVNSNFKMIVYGKSVFSVNILARIHGSAAYRATIPAALSVVIYVVIRQYINRDPLTPVDRLVSHPYAIGGLISSVTFVVIFRANFGYQRYWEGANSVYQMMSKWLDGATMVGAFHYQSKHYDAIKPPTFFDHPGMNFRSGLKRRRQLQQGDLDEKNNDVNKLQGKRNERSLEKDDIDRQSYVHDYKNHSDNFNYVDKNNDDDNDDGDEEESNVASNSSPLRRNKSVRFFFHNNNRDMNNTSSRSFENMEDGNISNISPDRSVVPVLSINNAQPTQSLHQSFHRQRSVRNLFTSEYSDAAPQQFMRKPQSSIFMEKGSTSSSCLSSSEEKGDERRKDKKQEELLRSMPLPYRNNKNRAKFQMHTNRGMVGLGRTDGGVSGDPSLFLQELCHLASLLNAVALSTLRNESDNNINALGEYVLNKPWPSVDAEDLNRFDAYGRLIRGLKYWLWLDRSVKERSKYNASRPLSVIGGVSAEEIIMLQCARGGSAKVNLCWFWIVEFITREHLSGSTGAVGPPIISRIYQFLSDGCIGYNAARKIAFIPFPFPHAQISLLSMVFLMVSIPLVTLEWSDQDHPWIGALLTFSIIEIIFGLHEVARELENPFVNVPNDLPLCALQAEFNESLLQLYNGYHPNSFWNTKEYYYVKNRRKSGRKGCRDEDCNKNLNQSDLRKSKRIQVVDKNEVKNNHTSI